MGHIPDSLIAFLNRIYYSTTIGLAETEAWLKVREGEGYEFMKCVLVNTEGRVIWLRGILGHEIGKVIAKALCLIVQGMRSNERIPFCLFHY